MKQIKVANHSIYSDGFYTSKEMNFVKLYRGVRVNVEHCCEDDRYMHFSIRTRKTRTCIWKRECDEMKSLVFDDASCSIFCDFDTDPRNRSLHTLQFEECVYLELKENIPAFMAECGCRFVSESTDEGLRLSF